MTDMKRMKGRFTWRAWLAAGLVAFATMPAVAAADNGSDAVLYEVTENMYFYDAHEHLIDPMLILTGQAQPAFRVANATLQGTAKLGNPLCPSDLLVTNPRAKTCTVTAAGADNISLLTGTGTVSGTYAVVLNVDNATDAPEYVVQTGAFVGNMDLSMRPLGKITGTFTPDGTAVKIPFHGTFRLPFAVSTGKRGEPRRGHQAYYLADDGKTLIHVGAAETSLGWPLVRLEISF